MKTENDSFQIGKFYSVPCAKIINPEGEDTGWVPIIGPKHKDVDLGVSATHYHINGRFCDKILKKRYGITDEGLTNIVLSTSPGGYKEIVSEIATKRKKCFRLNTGIKAPLFNNRYESFYKKHVGKSCKGKRCPHYGQKMIERDGVLYCPLHGLMGNIKTETIIPIKEALETQAAKNPNFINPNPLF